MCLHGSKSDTYSLQTILLLYLTSMFFKLFICFSCSVIPIEYGSPYKLSKLDQDELVRVVYHTLYPTLAQTSQAMASLYKKYSSATVAGERYGSTLASRLCPYPHVTASWCAENGCIDPSLMRPRIIRYYIVHSL